MNLRTLKITLSLGNGLQNAYSLLASLSNGYVKHTMNVVFLYTGSCLTNNPPPPYWRYNPLWVCILQPSSGAIASSRTKFLDHTQRRATVGRTPLDE